MAVIYDKMEDRRLGALLRRRVTKQEAAMEVFRVEADVTETLPDGRTIQVAAAGTEVPIAEARRLGLIKDEKQTGPAETKKPKE